MKVFIALACFIACVSASGWNLPLPPLPPAPVASGWGSPAPVAVAVPAPLPVASGWGPAPAPLPVASGWGPAPVLSTGTSTSSRTQDSAGNYAFSYNEQHGTGGSSRSESGNGWGASGSYSLNVGDGRKRTVKYVADGAGFRAAIATNEPGTAALPAASTAISSPYAPPQPVQPLPAPVAVAVAAPEPVAVAAPVLLAPVVKAIAPAVSSYSTSINHVSAAPVAVAVPEPVALPPKGWW